MPEQLGPDHTPDHEEHGTTSSAMGSGAGVAPGAAPGVAPGISRWTALDRLERQVRELIELCTILGRENRALRTQQQNWTTERAKLIEKNELAKSRVESMITRLKALEQD